MSRSGIEQMLYMMDKAFEGDPNSPGQNWNSLLVNLDSQAFEDWAWTPPDGRRSVATLVEELGVCKYAYASQGFGDRSIDWDKPETLPPPPDENTREAVFEWLRGAQAYLRGYVAALANDSELTQLRLSPQGPQRETRWLIATMIEHDLYHAGEINHIRALRQRND